MPFPADKRFSNIETDPRFRIPSRTSKHVRADKRFAHMFYDERFSSKTRVDRYGRVLPKDLGRAKLERYYRVNKDEEASNDEAEGSFKEVKRELLPANSIDGRSLDGECISESSEETSTDENGAETDEDAEVFGLPDQQADTANSVPVGEVTSRIAVVNLDWDNIRATDLMAVFSSFVPGNGRISKVWIYPSEFGKERMAREETEGPPQEIFINNAANGRSIATPGSLDESGEDDDNDDDQHIRDSIVKEDKGEEFDPSNLRRYQLERLRYYYGVLQCSSKATAEAIYNAVDGTEYLSTANFFDLRFVPHHVDFSDENPRDECAKLPDPYRPSSFVTDALQHSTVRLTWDAEDSRRKEVQRRAFNDSRADFNENDLKAYLGSDDSDDEEDNVKPIVVGAPVSHGSNGVATAESKVENPKLPKNHRERQRMRLLLGLGAEPSKTKMCKEARPESIGDLQITFASGLSAATKGRSIFENEPIIEETTAEKYIRKEKERKSRRKEKAKALRTSDEVSGIELSKPAERQILQSGDEDLGFEDPFFTAPEKNKSAVLAHRKDQKCLRPEGFAAGDTAAATERAKLELLMVGEDTVHTEDNGGELIHFDINEIAKAEKVALKKKRGIGRKLSVPEKTALETKTEDRFKMNVEDLRFQAIYQRSEFAIDPSNPRFRGTEGMRKLLEEGRRKRSRKESEAMNGKDQAVGDDKQHKAKKQSLINSFDGDSDVGKEQQLVQKVKHKTRNG